MAHASAVHGAVFSDRILALFIFDNLWQLRHANMPDYFCEFKMWFHHRKVGTYTRGSSTGCWEEYLDLRGAKIQESGEKYTVRSFGTYVLYRTLLGSLCQGGWMAGERARWHIVCVYVCVYIYIYVYICIYIYTYTYIVHWKPWKEEAVWRIVILTLRWLMSYIYGAPILDVSRSHTTTQHSR